MRLDTNFKTSEMNRCTFCLEQVIPTGRSNKADKYAVIAEIHSSGAKPCFFHEKCMVAWTKTREYSSQCPKCSNRISDVTYHQLNKNGKYTKVERPPLPEPPVRNTRCETYRDWVSGYAMGVAIGIVQLALVYGAYSLKGKYE